MCACARERASISSDLSVFVLLYCFTGTKVQMLTQRMCQGTVMMYSPNVMHRGRANTHDKEALTLLALLVGYESTYTDTFFSPPSSQRIIITLTLMGAHGLVPNGIPLAVLPQDEGRWFLEHAALNSV